jgi:tetratricopeptide (TPR) repeat protein
MGALELLVNLRRSSCIAAGIVGFAVSALAQLTGLEGDVRGADGKLLPGVEVRIARLDVSRSYPVKTDKKGHYFHSSLPAGLYSIAVQIDGQVLGGVNGVLTRQGTPLMVDIYLADTPEQRAERTKQQIRKMMGEWSYIKPMIVAGAPAPNAGGTPTGALASAQPTEPAKQRQPMNDAFGAGVAALDEKRYPEAIALFQKALETDPKQSIVWAHLGAAFVRLSVSQSGTEAAANLQKGLDAYAKAVDLKPDEAVLHNNYALALARAGKFLEMRTEIKKCADLDPPNAFHAYFNLGALLSNAAQTDAAANAFQQAIAVAPEDTGSAEAYYQYALILMSKAETASDGKMKPVAGTVEALRKYLELAPDGPNAQADKELLGALGYSANTGKSGKKK